MEHENIDSMIVFVEYSLNGLFPISKYPFDFSFEENEAFWGSKQIPVTRVWAEGAECTMLKTADGEVLTRNASNVGEDAYLSVISSYGRIDEMKETFYTF